MLSFQKVRLNNQRHLTGNSRKLDRHLQLSREGPFFGHTGTVGLQQGGDIYSGSGWMSASHFSTSSGCSSSLLPHPPHQPPIEILRSSAFSVTQKRDVSLPQQSVSVTALTSGWDSGHFSLSLSPSYSFSIFHHPLVIW